MEMPIQAQTCASKRTSGATTWFPIVMKQYAMTKLKAAVNPTRADHLHDRERPPSHFESYWNTPVGDSGDNLDVLAH